MAAEVDDRQQPEDQGLDGADVGTEHILLALLELEDGDGVLTGLGLTKAGTEENVLAALEAVRCVPESG